MQEASTERTTEVKTCAGMGVRPFRELGRALSTALVRLRGISPRSGDETAKGTDSPAHALSGPGTARRSRALVALILILAGMGGLFLHRTLRERRRLIEMVPQQSLFYLEVEDPAQVLRELRATRAWRDLLPRVPEGASLDLELLGDLREEMWIARSPMALLLTGLEWEGETIRPHLALLWMTEQSDRALSQFAETYLPKLLGRAHRELTPVRMEHEGIPITGYRTCSSDRGLFWSVHDGTLLVANHPDTLRAVIETAQGRRPSLLQHPQLPGLRRAVERPSGWRRSSPGPIWGWASGEALALGARALGETGSPLLREIARAMAAALSFHFAFAVEFEDGQVVTRSILGLSQKWTERYEPLLRPGPLRGDEPLLQLIPKSARHFTLYRWTDTERLADALAETLTAALPQPLTLILPGMLRSMREALGLDSEDALFEALGSELALVDTGDPMLLVVVRLRDAPKMAAMIGKHLQRAGGTVREIRFRGTSFFTSTAHPERAFAFLQGYLLTGHPKQLEQVVLARERQETAGADPAIRSSLAGTAGFEVVLTREHVQAARALLSAARRLPVSGFGPTRGPDQEALRHLTARWAPAVRVSELRPEGLWSESRSPLGPFSLLLALLEEKE